MTQPEETVGAVVWLFGEICGTFGQSRCVAVMDKIAESFTVCSYELLRLFDGVKGYSMAQGK